MYEMLMQRLSANVDITPEDRDTLKRFYHPVNFPKHHVITNLGEIEDYQYFITDGFARTYFKSDGLEITTRIGKSDQFISAQQSFVKRLPSTEVLESITRFKGLRIHYADLKKMYEMDDKWIRASLHIMEGAVIDQNERMRQLTMLSAKERYELLVNENPTLLQNIALRYIASYIGIKPESLSRIRSNLNTRAHKKSEIRQKVNLDQTLGQKF